MDLLELLAQPSPDEVHAQLDRVTDQLQNRFPQVASLLDEAGPDVLAFSNFPLAHWKKIWSNNPQERLNKEIRRRTDVVGIFPNRPAVRRLVGAVLAEQHDEWAVGPSIHHTCRADLQRSSSRGRSPRRRQPPKQQQHDDRQGSPGVRHSRLSDRPARRALWTCSERPLVGRFFRRNCNGLRLKGIGFRRIRLTGIIVYGYSQRDVHVVVPVDDDLLHDHLEKFPCAAHRSARQCPRRRFSPKRGRSPSAAASQSRSLPAPGNRPASSSRSQAAR